MQLDVVASGMVTPVGYQAASSCAAIRVGLDNFRETGFVWPSRLGLAGPLAWTTGSSRTFARPSITRSASARNEGSSPAGAWRGWRRFNGPTRC